MNRTDWHAGFVSAMKLELMAYDQHLTFEEEHYQDNRAQRMDLLIIKNDRRLRIDREIGAVFDKYNIIEYKSPDDSLNLGDFYQAISYACIYLKEKHEYDLYGRDAYTVTLIWEGRPAKLLEQLSRDGLTYQNIAPGIIVFDQAVPFRTQIIMYSKLPREYSWLKKLTKRGTVGDVGDLVTQMNRLSENQNSKYKEYANSVARVFSKSNKEAFRIAEEDSKMAEEMKKSIFDVFDELDEKNHKIEEKDKKIEEKDKKIEEKDKKIEEKDKKIEELEGEVSVLQKAIETLKEQIKNLTTNAAAL